MPEPRVTLMIQGVISHVPENAMSARNSIFGAPVVEFASCFLRDLGMSWVRTLRCNAGLAKPSTEDRFMTFDMCAALCERFSTDGLCFAKAQ